MFQLKADGVGQGDELQTLMTIEFTFIDLINNKSLREHETLQKLFGQTKQ